MPDFFDIHAHVHFDEYASDKDEVMRRALDAGVWMIQVGVDKETSASACELAQAYDKGVYASVGLHPVYTGPSYSSEVGEVFDRETYKRLAQHPRVVAIGECGLDYFRADKAGADLQKKVFEEQIQLACELNKPLILHIRGEGAYADAYEILKRYPKARGDVHFFAGTWQEAQWFLSIGFTLSFTGVITFARDYDEVVKNTPLEMLIAETDAPYVAPAPYRGKRNEPLYVREVVQKIAEIRGEDPEMVKKALCSNAFRVFDFNPSL